MAENGETENQDTDVECCTDRRTRELYVTDLLARPVDILRVTEEATITGTKRGQDVKKCPTDPLPLHGNLTAAIVNVSGDLKIDAKSCEVEIDYAVGAAGGAVFQPGTDIGITVPVAAGFVMIGHCVKTKDKKICKWSFTRTSP